MKEPDRDTIYTGVLLACGLPPKPQNYAMGYATPYGTHAKAHRNWEHLAHHILYTALRDWMEAKAEGPFHAHAYWKEEKQEFMSWIAQQQLTVTLESYSEQPKHTS